MLRLARLDLIFRPAIGLRSRDTLSDFVGVVEHGYVADWFGCVKHPDGSP